MWGELEIPASRWEPSLANYMMPLLLLPKGEAIRSV